MVAPKTTRVGGGIGALLLTMMVMPAQALAAPEPPACAKARALRAEKKPAAAANAERNCKAVLARQAKQEARERAREAEAKKRAEKRAREEEKRRKAEAAKKEEAARAKREQQEAAIREAARIKLPTAPAPAPNSRAGGTPVPTPQELLNGPAMTWDMALPMTALEVEEAGLDAKLDISPATFPKRWAAREVIVQFIEAMSGRTRQQLLSSSPSSDVESRLASRVKLYLAPTSPVADRSEATLAGAAKVAADPAFHKRVVGRLAPPAERAKYYSSEHFQKVVTLSAQGSPAGKLTKSRLDAEKDPKVDRTVFGFALGDPMRFPRCTVGQRPPADGICYVPQGLGAIVHGTFAAGIWERIPGTEQVSINVGSGRCPDWLGGCGAVLVLKDGYIVGAQFTSDKDDGYTQAKLSAKYGTPKVSRLTPIDCSTRYSSAISKAEVVHRSVDRQLRSWRKPSLMVDMSQGCNGPMIEIRTGVLQRLLENLDASSPKL